jgi:hypothetical protein
MELGLVFRHSENNDVSIAIGNATDVARFQLRWGLIVLKLLLIRLKNIFRGKEKAVENCCCFSESSWC